MDGGVTDEQANAWLQEIADAGWISLHYESPGLLGVGRAEISGGGYTRFLMSWTQPSNRTIWSMTDAIFSGLLQTQITHFGIWNASVNGRLMAYGSLPAITTLLNGQGYLLHEGDLCVSIG